ncbi:hypothetical protein LCGC14_1561270 [marine sediment metagenome]|uniref:Uncharacterized protein n=1 Tax=marine sediment metagenome TaxID=412755 RepID=A0A0F9LN32_9ZZZZ
MSEYYSREHLGDVKLLHIEEVETEIKVIGEPYKVIPMYEVRFAFKKDRERNPTTCNIYRVIVEKVDKAIIEKAIIDDIRRQKRWNKTLKSFEYLEFDPWDAV